jgi:hypothetical protein
VVEVEVQECYEGCPDSPNILDLCDPDTEEAAANRTMKILARWTATTFTTIK